MPSATPLPGSARDSENTQFGRLALEPARSGKTLLRCRYRPVRDICPIASPDLHARATHRPPSLLREFGVGAGNPAHADPLARRTEHSRMRNRVDSEIVRRTPSRGHPAPPTWERTAITAKAFV